MKYVDKNNLKGMLDIIFQRKKTWIYTEIFKHVIENERQLKFFYIHQSFSNNKFL